ncbi:ATP-dependent 6-phosphofructokinase [Allostella sp. ATCC 35155]|nr:ATP-dependent 6-phosphofructokinase [Stella sp. ATCC 35155]
MTAKRIGILTSGGDCAGLNAVIRAVVLAARQRGWTVVGIRQGTRGLMARPPMADELGPAATDTIMMRMGGTILGTTNQGDPFDYPMADGSRIDRSEEVIEGYRLLDLDALIGIGGDGSMAILRRLARQGDIPLIGIPKTIDNDIGLTETAIGYQTAVAVATEALDRLQPTAASHSRVMILEVMGRDAGHIALATGIAGGADVILIPEIPYEFAPIADHLRQIHATGRNFALVVVAEAVLTEEGRPVRQDRGSYGGIGHYVAERLTRDTGAEVRVTVLGHVQRGGQPTSGDRLLASALGVQAVQLVAEGRFDRMVAWINRQVGDVPIQHAIEHYQAVDPDGAIVATARGLGICFGDRPGAPAV